MAKRGRLLALPEAHRFRARTQRRFEGRETHSRRRGSGHDARHRLWDLPLRHVLQHHLSRGLHRSGHRPQPRRRGHRHFQSLLHPRWIRPLPHRTHDEVGEKMRAEGHEFGATTGRPRRCGWLDLPQLRYAVDVNGATQLSMMKADVLGCFDEVHVHPLHAPRRKD